MKRTLALLWLLFSLGVMPAGCDDDELHPDNYLWNDGPYLTLDGSPDSVCINWLTEAAQPSELYWGVAPGEPATREYVEEHVKFHHICLAGLAPDTLYSYSIPVLFSEESEEKVYTFRSPSAAYAPFTFAVVGDMQPYNDEMVERVQILSDALLAENPQFVIQLGDIVQRGTVRHYWHNLFLGAASLFSEIPFLSVMGNHDWGYDDGDVWRELLPFPYIKERASYHKIDVAKSRFLFLDCYEKDYSISDEQLQWLESELEQTPADWFTFVVMHGSIFSTGMENMDNDLQQKIAPICDKHGVTAVFYGHDHMYEHYILNYGANGYLFDESHQWPHGQVHYFLSGGGGAYLEYDYGITTRPVRKDHLTLFNEATGAYEQLNLEVRPWDESRVVTWAPELSTPLTPNCYHIADQVSHQDHAEFFGQEYGENTLHYIKVDLEEDRCVISVRYPDGSLLEGPDYAHPQEWVIARPQ